MHSEKEVQEILGELVDHHERYLTLSEEMEIAQNERNRCIKLICPYNYSSAVIAELLGLTQRRVQYIIESDKKQKVKK